jgi:hypothetical protein
MRVALPILRSITRAKGSTGVALLERTRRPMGVLLLDCW